MQKVLSHNIAQLIALISSSQELPYNESEDDDDVKKYTILLRPIKGLSNCTKCSLVGITYCLTVP